MTSPLGIPRQLKIFVKTEDNSSSKVQLAGFWLTFQLKTVKHTMC